MKIRLGKPGSKSDEKGVKLTRLRVPNMLLSLDLFGKPVPTFNVKG